MPGTLTSEYPAFQVLPPVWLQKTMGWAPYSFLRGLLLVKPGWKEDQGPDQREVHPIPFLGGKTKT